MPASGHQPGGCCRADARERPHYGRDPHPARRLPVLGQDLSEAEPALLQLTPDRPSARRSALDGLETRSVSLGRLIADGGGAALRLHVGTAPFASWDAPVLDPRPHQPQTWR